MRRELLEQPLHASCTTASALVGDLTWINGPRERPNVMVNATAYPVVDSAGQEIDPPIGVNATEQIALGA